MSDSILNSIKKLRGITEEYTQFDSDLIIAINSALSILTQLGVGPDAGFSIYDSTAKWSDFIPDNDPRLQMVKTYVDLKVKLIFDPPLSSGVMEAANKILTELEWRINVAVDPSMNDSDDGDELKPISADEIDEMWGD